MQASKTLPSAEFSEKGDDFCDRLFAFLDNINKTLPNLGVQEAKLKTAVPFNEIIPINVIARAPDKRGY